MKPSDNDKQSAQTTKDQKVPEGEKPKSEEGLSRRVLHVMQRSKTSTREAFFSSKKWGTYKNMLLEKAFPKKPKP